MSKLEKWFRKWNEQAVLYWTPELEEKAKQEIKDMFLELVGKDEIAAFDYGDATYGDTLADHRSVIVGRNESREEFRAKIGAL